MRAFLPILLLLFLSCSDAGPDVSTSAPDGSFGTPGDPDVITQSDLGGTNPDGATFGGKDGGETSDAKSEDAQSIPDGTEDEDTPTDTVGVEDVGADTDEIEDIAEPIPDVPFDDPDTGCTPDCEEKECGSDGCGSICGFCQYGNACNDESACIAICDPVTPCVGKVCGPDGCGGTCGDCNASFACGGDGLCYESDCVPECEDKECGPDGCGGVCGTCKGVKLCDTDAGECVANPCGNVGFKGACVDKYTVVQCLGAGLEFTDCTVENEAWGCIWDAFDGIYECGELPDCTPDCTDKQCGDGGCNYMCGGCFDGWSCVNFTCTPEVGGACGTIPSIGTCIDNQLYFCSGGAIYVEDCESAGKTCKFNSSLGKMSCE